MSNLVIAGFIAEPYEEYRDPFAVSLSVVGVSQLSCLFVMCPKTWCDCLSCYVVLINDVIWGFTLTVTGEG